MSSRANSRARWSPVLIALVVGLVVAMTGSATAATLIGSKQIKRNAVGAKHLKNGAVGPKQIKNRAVNGKKIKANAIKPGHISPKAKNALAGKDGADGQDGATGPQGPKGEKGDKGDTGPQGEPGDDSVTGWERVEGTAVGISAGEDARRSVSCPDGKVIVGTDLRQVGSQAGSDGYARIASSWTNPAGTTWTVDVFNAHDTGLITVVPYVNCVNGS